MLLILFDPGLCFFDFFLYKLSISVLFCFTEISNLHQRRHWRVNAMWCISGLRAYFLTNYGALFDDFRFRFRPSHLAELQTQQQQSMCRNKVIVCSFENAGLNVLTAQLGPFAAPQTSIAADPPSRSLPSSRCSSPPERPRRLSRSASNTPARPR